MEDLNYKLEGLKDTVKKIKKEIKSFEENESKNAQNRTNTFSNKIYRHSSYTRKSHLNKLNKKLIKNYLKLSLKEQNFYNNKNYNNNKSNKNNNIDNNPFKEILTPQQKNKITNRAKKYLTKQNSNNGKKFKKDPYFRTINRKINDNNNNCNDNNLNQKKILLMTDINNTINNSNNINDTSMNKNLIKFMITKNKDYAMNQKIENKINNKFGQTDKIIMTYSNDFKKNIFSSYFNKNKKNNKKELLYNVNNHNNYNYDFINDENISNNVNNSTYFYSKNNHKNNRSKKVHISDLLNNKFNNEKSYSNKNINNNNSFFQENKKIDIKKNHAINEYKNNSYNCKIKLIPNLIHANNTYREPMQNQQLNKNNNDYYSYRRNFNNNAGKYTIGDEILNVNKYLNKEPNLIQEYNHYNKKQINFPMNNTINYIKNNNSDIGLYYDDEEIINKNKIKNIIGNYSISDLYIKAKLFEKYGEDNFKKFVNNFGKVNDLNNNLKKYKNFLIQIKEEENQYKKQINIYQKLCKKIMQLMNRKEINDIFNEIQDYIYENEGNDNYFFEQIKSIFN